MREIIIYNAKSIFMLQKYTVWLIKSVIFIKSLQRKHKLVAGLMTLANLCYDIQQQILRVISGAIMSERNVR